MKKYTLALVLTALMPLLSANAYEYTGSQVSYHKAPIAKTTSTKKASNTRKTGGYKNVITNNFYYGQIQKSYGPNYASANNVEKTKVKRTYSAQERKYFLAHPFFQPLEGKFGSVSDFSYAHNSFNVNLLNGITYDLSTDPVSVYGPAGLDISGKAETSQFAVKEDISYGLSDTLALMLMAQYDATKVTFKDWNDPTAGNDTKSSSGLNLFGIGLQGRFVDTDKWIVMGDALFQHQKDSANTFMLGVKGGYKISKTTIYGLGRLSYTNLIKGNTYGAYVDKASNDWLMLAYKTDVDNIFMGELGFGAFGVLGRYVSLNGEIVYGFYDWHNQLNAKLALGVQPVDMFALNLYASAVLYDSAKNKTLRYMRYEPVALYTVGDYKINDYKEWKVGIQAILYF